MSSYGDAGVSLAKAEEVVERLRAAVESTRTERVEGSLGAFAGLFALDDERLLAATTDGVGTKLILSRRAGRLFDAAPTSPRTAPTTLTTGRRAALLPGLRGRGRSTWPRWPTSSPAPPRPAARPAARFSAARPPSSRVSTATASSTSPGRGRLVERADLVDGTRCEPGDAVLGLPSSGLHANGFTLVRGLLGDGDFDADLLLPPTRLYLDDVRALRASCNVRALAHVTGGGIPGNLPRVLPAGLGAAHRPGELGAAARLRLAGRARRPRGGAAPRLQPRHRLLRGRASGGRARAGVPSSAGSRRDRRRRLGGRAVIGVLVSGAGTNLQALIDQGLPIAAVAVERGRRRSARRASAPGSRPASSRSRTTPGREERDLAMADWLAGHGSSSSSAPGTCTCSRPRSSRASPRSTSTPRSLPAFPGTTPIEDALAAGVAETGVTVHFVDEGVDTGPGDLPGARCRSSRATRPRRCASASTRSSTGCCPRPRASIWPALYAPESACR